MQREEAIMAHSNGLITAPIGVDSDIPQVLGISSTDVGYQCSNAHGRINMWSKVKPVIYDKASELTDSERHSVAYGLSFVEGGNHDYGIFTYHPPKDGNWFRVTDFGGYDHNMPTGLCLKTYTVTKDMFNDRTALVIPLEDDIRKITCYDVRDTLLNGYQLACLITAKSGTGKYWVGYIPVDKQSLSWTVPFIDLTTKLGAGEYSIVLNAYKNGSTIGFFPRGYESGTLKLTSDTGITISLWPNSIQFIDGGTSYSMSLYYGGVGSRILNLTNQDLIFSTLNLDNKSAYAISNNNIFVQFRWPGSGGEYYSYVPLRVGVNLIDWSISAGSGSTNRYGCISSQIPKMTNSSEGNILVTTNIVYKHTDGYYYNVTDYVILRMKKDSGPTPDFIQR